MKNLQNSSGIIKYFKKPTEILSRKKIMNVKEPPPPTIEELKSFWSIIGSHQKSYKIRWMENIKVIHKNNEAQMCENITIQEIMNTLRRTHKWKSPGTDKIINFSSSIFHQHVN